MVKKLYQKQDLDFYILGHEDVDQLLDFVDMVYQDLEDKSLYFRTSKEDVIKYLDQGSIILGVFDEERLVAFRHTAVQNFEDSLLKDLLSGIEDGQKVVYNKSCMVHKDYRGRNLQNLTRKMLEEDLIKEGHIHFYSTVSNKNTHSFKNVFKNGFYLLDFKVVYYDNDNNQELERFIFYKNIKEDVKFKEADYKIKIKDTEAIKLALENSLLAVACDDEHLIFKEIEE